MNLGHIAGVIRRRLADAAEILGLPRDILKLERPPVISQPSTMYKTPEKPGFIGGYQWKSAGVGLLFLFLANVAATQVVAAIFSYQPALGPAWLRIGKWAFYAPWMWGVWLAKFGSAENPNTRFFILIGPLVLAIGIMAALGVVYALNLRRTRKLSANTSDLHGSSRWASEADMRDAGILEQPEGVYIGGWHDKRKQQLQYLRHNGPEHILAFAPTRSGKGVSLVIPTLLAWKGSVVVYDIKGENWAKTAGRREQLDNLCLQFSPCDEHGRSTRFNPLAEIRVGSMRDVSDAQNIADILVKNTETKPTDTHWVDTAAMIVTGALLHIAYVAAGEGREANLGDLATLFATHGQSFKDTLKVMSVTEHDVSGKMGWKLPDGRDTRVHPTVLEAVQKMLDKADREFSSVVSTINTALQLYADPIIRQNTAASDFRIADLVNFEQPLSLYISVPPSDRIRLAPLLRLTFTLIVNRLTQKMDFAPIGDSEGGQGSDRPLRQVANKHRLLLLIDEFPTLKRMELFADALSYMGGYGIKAYLIAQDLQQILENYGQYESIVSNCHVRVAFAPNKFETAKLLSDMTGRITIEKAQYTFSGNRVSPVLDHITSSVQQIERPLMTPDEVSRLAPAKKQKEPGGTEERIVAPGEMLIFVSGKPPILGMQMLYFLDQGLRRASDLRPPLHLQAIEDGVVVPQRPLNKARHLMSRPEHERPTERELAPVIGEGILQPGPPPHSSITAHFSRQDPHYVPPTSPPKPTTLPDAHFERIEQHDVEIPT